MGKKSQPPVDKPRFEIRNFILVAVCGAVIAVAAAFYVALSHGTAGTYLGGNVMLSPELLIKAEPLKEIVPTARMGRSWVFDSIKVIYPDGQVGFLEASDYDKLYQRLSFERSVKAPETELSDHFRYGGVTQLLLTLKPRGRYAKAFSAEEFQKIEIAPRGDLIRVELAESGKGWAYFALPGISYEAKSL